MLNLNIKERDAKKKVDQADMPAVFYGKKEESTPVSVKKTEFSKVFEEAGESTVINLKRDWGDDLNALIHDVALHPVSHEPIHADFYIFEKGKKVEVSVPIEFVGESPAEKELGGIVIKVMHELHIQADPTKLPHSIEVDISSLENFDSIIAIKDVTFPEGVEPLSSEEEVVVSVSEPKEEVVEEEVEVDLSSIEVESKGKEKDGEESSEEKKEEGK